MSAPPNIATGQIALQPGTPIQVVAARTQRVELILTPIIRSGTIAIGTSSLNATDGFILLLDPQKSFTLATAAEIWAVASGAGGTISFLEIYTN